LTHRGEDRHAIQLARRVIHESTEEEHAARAAMIVGVDLFRTRHFSWAIQFSEKAAAYYRWVDEPILLSWCWINLGLCYKALGQFDVALAFIRKASRMLPRRGKYLALVNEGVVLMQLGESPLARAAFTRAIDSDSPGSPLLLYSVTNNLGHTYRMQGRLAKALEFYQSANEIAVEADFKRQECISLYWSGETHMEIGAWTEARKALAAAEAIATQLKHGGLRFEVALRQADLLARRGNRSAAAKKLAQAARLCKTLKQPRDQAFLLRSEMFLRSVDRSHADLHDLITRFRRLGDRYEFSKTVLMLLETCSIDPRSASWLESAEIEARYYMAIMGLESWLQRLNEAVHRGVAVASTAADFTANREAFERAQIEAALARSQGAIGKAAELLSTGRNTLAQKMKLYRVDRKRFAH
jgi:tetratricopeptide (TPR) repeat protein